MGINFKCSKDEMEIIQLIAERADREVFSRFAVDQTVLDTEMDITACHLNGCPLKLEELLAADGFNFSHDVKGIRRYLDRSTGELRDWFLPRFAK